jgi:hypothetical protein
MLGKNIQEALESEKKHLSQQDHLLQEAERILLKSRFLEKNILANLKFYNSSFEFLDDDEVENEKTFTPVQVRNLCKKLRLRFLSSQSYAGEIPYEAVLKIKELNTLYRKDLKYFKIVSTERFFNSTNDTGQAMLFAQTLCGHYYLIHMWGKPLGTWRSVRFFALRNFESLFICLLLFSLAEALLMPTHLITTDAKAGYLSLYRIACIFHLVIFNAGFTVFTLFSFHLTFSESNWDTIPKKKR